MDRFAAEMIAQGLTVVDGDLTIAAGCGMAWQTDMRVTAAYDDAYMEKCAAHDPKMVSAINEGRRMFVLKRVPAKVKVLDIGVGDGAFIRTRPNTYGFDVNPAAERWLRLAGLWANKLSGWQAVTMWDVIEHCPVPEDYLKQIGVLSHLFVSIPVFDDLSRIRESHHYRPGEHLYYWTPAGFTAWMARHGFKVLASSYFESEAGRSNIASFAFIRERQWHAP